MNILLVGEKADLFSKISDIASRRQYPIEHIFHAKNLNQAIKLLSEKKILLIFTELCLSDGSGLDILRYLQASRSRRTVVLWAEKMNFPAVREAMHLLAYDFVIGELNDEEVGELLRVAMDGVEIIGRIDALYQRVNDFRQENRMGYWHDLLFSDEQTIPQDLILLGHYKEYSDASQFYLCILSIADGAETMPSWKEYAVRNVMEDLCMDKKIHIDAVLPLTDGDSCYVLRVGEDTLPEEISVVLTSLTNFVRRELGGWINCYYSERVGLEDARASFDHLRACYEDDVISRGAVVRASEYKIQDIPYSLPEIQEWELLVTCRRADELVRRINLHLENLAEQKIVNKSYLKAMRIQMMQMLQSVLKDNHLDAYNIYADLRFDKLREDSLRSVDHMKRYLEYIVRTAVSYLDSVGEEQTVIGQVKEYIDHHYQEDISRNTIARKVFLNPDYLARIFKNETGMSLGAYIKKRRIDEAKKLLAQTNVHINEIAIRVGYENPSYFSYIFRKYTGLTPKEYRRQNFTENQTFA